MAMSTNEACEMLRVAAHLLSQVYDRIDPNAGDKVNQACKHLDTAINAVTLATYALEDPEAILHDEGGSENGRDHGSSGDADHLRRDQRGAPGSGSDPRGRCMADLTDDVQLPVEVSIDWKDDNPDAWNRFMLHRIQDGLLLLRGLDEDDMKHEGTLFWVPVESIEQMVVVKEPSE